MSGPDGAEPDVVARILAADPGHAAAIVVAMPWERGRAVLARIGPREVARLLVGARGDRVPDLVATIAPQQLPQVLANLDVMRIAALVPLLPMEAAVRVVQNMTPTAAADLLLALPTHQRLALQQALPPPAAPDGGGGSDYARRVEEAVRRVTGTATWRDPRAGTLMTEVFGRSVQVSVRDAPRAPLVGTELHAIAAATDWRQISGLLVMTNSPLDPGLAAAAREVRGRGYLIEVLQWQDERDEGALKRVLVRLIR